MRAWTGSRLTVWIGLAHVMISALSSELLLAAEVRIPGTSVSLDAPPGFEVSADFSGLQNARDGSTIVVTEMPAAACNELHPVFTDLDVAISSFRPRGVTIAQAKTYRVGDQSVPALIGSQPGPLGEVQKYLALYCADVAVLLVVNALDPRALPPSIVADAIESVRLAPAVSLQQKLDELPFTFSVTAPFRVGDTIGGASVMLPSFDGVDPSGLKPLVVIARAVSAVDPASDVRSVAKQLLRTTRGFENAETTRLETVNFGGGPGALLSAVAGERSVIQYLRIPADGMYIRLLGMGATADLDRVMQAVEYIAASVAVVE